MCASETRTDSPRCEHQLCHHIVVITLSLQQVMERDNRHTGLAKPERCNIPA